MIYNDLHIIYIDVSRKVGEVSLIARLDAVLTDREPWTCWSHPPPDDGRTPNHPPWGGWKMRPVSVGMVEFNGIMNGI